VSHPRARTLVDPLPAGREALNPALAVNQTVPPPADEASSTPAFWWPWWTWLEHENLGDDRVEAFASYLPRRHLRVWRHRPGDHPWHVAVVVE
jgi:hypothetical protein